MAYENMTYEYIMQRMLARVTEKYPNLDNREGSIIFNALAPAAVELAIMYNELENVLNESFVDTASREYILMACQQMGMDTSVFNANAGVHKAQFNIQVEIGSRWNCELYNYTVVDYLGWQDSYHTYSVECETTGSAPNNITGDLTPITEIPANLTYARLVECLIEGENETEDEDIRVAYYEFVNSTISDGNVKQYERWCNEYDGIGNYKIIPLWNGDNTVKVSILSASNGVASDELIDEFQEYLDPGTTGMGDGKAPIGAFVTVSTATEVPVSVSADVVMKSGYDAEEEIDAALRAYLAEIAYKKSSLSYVAVGAVILNVNGVDSVSNLLINDGTADVQFGNEEIAVLGETSWG